MSDLNTKLIAMAHDAIFGAAPAPRAIDRRRLLDSMRKFDWEMRERHYAPVIEAEYERDAEEFFAAEQCPSDSTFR